MDPIATTLHAVILGFQGLLVWMIKASQRRNNVPKGSSELDDEKRMQDVLNRINEAEQAIQENVNNTRTHITERLAEIRNAVSCLDVRGNHD